jgi:hypothetical protein
VTDPGYPLAKSLLLEAEAVCGSVVDLVAMDMPLSRATITGRRASDNAVSTAFGARGCSTLSPSATRPGPLGAALTGAFHDAGYPLQTQQIVIPGLIEVYRILPSFI